MQLEQAGVGLDGDGWVWMEMDGFGWRCVGGGIRIYSCTYLLLSTLPCVVVKVLVGRPSVGRVWHQLFLPNSYQSCAEDACPHVRRPSLFCFFADEVDHFWVSLGIIWTSAAAGTVCASACRERNEAEVVWN